MSPDLTISAAECRVRESSQESRRIGASSTREHALPRAGSSSEQAVAVRQAVARRVGVGRGFVDGGGGVLISHVLMVTSRRRHAMAWLPPSYR